MLSLSEYLKKLRTRGIRPGLEPLRSALKQLGNPEKRFRSIIIGGTNGKGSVAWYLDALLRDAGLQIARYTSPTLTRFTERLVRQGEEFPYADWEKLHAELLARFPDGFDLTEFEYITLLAFVMIARARVDYAVLEVGLGGRLDAVNVAQSELAIITSVGLDHQEYLGLTIPEIAFEKAGIMRQNKPVLVGTVPPEALQVIVEQARYQGARPYFLGHDFTAFQGELRHHAPVQLNNAGLATAAARMLLGTEFAEDSAAELLSELVLPGRGEEILFSGKRFYLDTAHNPAAAQSLAMALREMPGPCHGLLGLLQDKDAEGFFCVLAPVLDSCTLVNLPAARSAAAVDLFAVARKYMLSVTVVEEPVASAFQIWQETLPAGALAVVSGSHHLVGPIRELICRQE